tara:strand:+ start:7153 stop:7482 length:330 start_codon:yes stop_codon:yes gene_type:complete
MANQTSSAIEPKFVIESARVSGTNMKNDEITSALLAGEVQFRPGDVIFIESGLNPEDTLLSLQTYAYDKYNQYCSDNAEVSSKTIKICNTDEQNICVAFKTKEQAKRAL